MHTCMMIPSSIVCQLDKNGHTFHTPLITQTEWVVIICADAALQALGIQNMWK